MNDVALIRWAGAMRGRPFAWGETDCASFACQALGILGHRPIVDDWRDGLEAWRLARRVDIAAILTAAGLRRVTDTPVAGDILVVQRAWPCFHVCLGRLALSSSANAGVTLHDTAALEGAAVWRA